MDKATNSSYVNENFFKFPIKMYDFYSMINAEIQEDKQEKTENFVQPVHVDWATTIKVCRPESIVGWVESADREQDVSAIVEEGLNRTVVDVLENREIKSYECLWDRKRFETELDKRMKNKLI